MISQEELELRTSLSHHGILGQKWGIRRYQDEKGNYTSAGKKRYIKDKTSGIQKDIDSFKSVKNGIKDKKGRQLLTKEDVDSSVAGLKAQKAKQEAKLSRKWDINKVSTDFDRSATSAEKFVYNEATRKRAAKFVVDKNMPMTDALKKAKGEAWRNTAIYVGVMGGLTVAQIAVSNK